jgi:hypothetical protein
MPMRSGLFLPLFDELADPAIIARLSAEAEQAGRLLARIAARSARSSSSSSYPKATRNR